MTDNIQKLYEIAGIKEKRGVEFTIDATSEELKFNEHYVCYGYPPFTAEKQLELIKWLASSRKGILISDMGEGEFNISTGFYYCAKHIMNFKNNKDLGIVIATFINDIWQDLSYDQKQEIKRILQ